MTSGALDLVAEIRAVARGWAEAVVSNDSARVAGFMADEWVIVSDSGITTRADFLELISSGELTHSAMDEVGEPLIQVYGDTAVYTARVTNTAHYQGERFDADEWTTDVFVRDARGWRCVRSHIATVKG
ncbi:nuclear transport factor 2 family protein [Nocardia sp. NPDC051832]|uniref:nuclear transport factor 2 family protein n=1 Tax=Nocardia sp. NPDC051832 TaxID=3155673 RepID=UPI0034146FDE